MLKIALIGATGSIGRQTLAVIDRHPDEFCLYSAVSRRGGDGFVSLAKKYRPRFCALADGESGEKLRGEMPVQPVPATNVDIVTDLYAVGKGA